MSEDYDTGPYAIERLTGPGSAGCDPSVTAPGAAGNCPRAGSAGSGGSAGSAGSPADAPGGGGSGAGGGAAPASPAPPSLGEAVATCPSPGAPVIGRNPEAEGVTGLATYLWAQPQESLSSAGSVRGYPVACTVTAVSWTWRTGDGGSYTRERPGGPHPDNPAEHVYETKGDYELSLAVVWRAVTSYGTGEMTRTTVEPYHVFEIRSVLTG